jgi:diguanylate cyclase (GGDEF)-like protein
MSDYIAAAATNAVIFQPVQDAFPVALREWLGEVGVPLVTVASADELMAYGLRSRPRFILLDGRVDADAALSACRRIKGDAYTSVSPVIFVTDGGGDEAVAAFDVAADEVIRMDYEPREITARLRAMMHRSDRDVGVHPSTRLPGAWAIQGEIAKRMSTPLAVCYADLDHFKEFNDRYSYTEGDRVIRILATLLHDVVKGTCGTDGFVGHIGGDDFIFIIPRDRVDEVCAEIVETFDTLIVYQYSEHDRRAGYFFGKDRRGQLHRVPLMTLSIGVVTNERRSFGDAKMVSELATEMKTYAKTLAGSVYAVDRRIDDRAKPPLSTPQLTRVGTA